MAVLGVIDNQEALLTEWINECTYQLASIGGPDESGSWKSDDSTWQNGTSKANRQAIRVGKIAITLEFEDGPKIILGGVTDSGNNGWGGAWDVGKYVDLATQIRGTDVKIKFCPNIIAPMKSPDASGMWPDGGLIDWTAGGDDNISSIWKGSMANAIRGLGWGVTIGSMAGAPAAHVASDAPVQHDDGTIGINSPTGMSGGPAGYQDHDIDTVLYKYLLGNDGTGTWAAVTSEYDNVNNWGPQEVQENPDRAALDGMNGYNYGGLTNISFWITMSGGVRKQDDSGLSDKWEFEPSGVRKWYKLINQDITYDASTGAVTNDQADGSLSSTDESIKKLGWLGPLDYDTDGNPPSSEPGVYRLDVNDGIQDVRVRFALQGRSSQGSAGSITTNSGCWAPKDLLNWAFRKGDTSTWDATVLYPSRFSILSRNSNFQSKCYEIYSGLNQANSKNGFQRLAETGSVSINPQGIDSNADFQPLDLQFGWNATAANGGPGPYIQLLSKAVDYPADGASGLVADVNTEENKSATTIYDSEAKLEGNFTAPHSGNVQFGDLNVVKYLTSAGIPSGNDGYWAGATNESGWATAANNYTTDNIATTWPDLTISIFNNTLTLLLFDPMLWWDNSLPPTELNNSNPISTRNGQDGGTFSSAGVANYWDNPDYLFIKVLNIDLVSLTEWTNGDKFT